MPGKYTYVTWKNGRLVKRTKYYNKFNVPQYVSKDPKTKRTKPMYMRGCKRFSTCNYYPKSSDTYRIPLECGYTRNQAWIALCRAWMGLAISNHNNDLRKMELYGNVIHEIQGELGLDKTKFYNVSTKDDYFLDDLTRDDYFLDDLALTEAGIASGVGLDDFGSIDS